MSPSLRRSGFVHLAVLLVALLLGACAGPVPDAGVLGARATPGPSRGAGAVSVPPRTATPSRSPSPSPSADASPGGTAKESRLVAAREGAAASAVPTAPPTAEPTAGPPAATPPTERAGGSGGTASGPTHRVATRVVIPGLGIDLPVTRQRASYPECNVAMYLPQLGQPGQGGATYLYAHARRGMFLPLLERSRMSNGASMIGLRVEVYTGDNKRFVYRIDEVRRHVTDLRYVERRRGESLWLQTSEGPRGTVPKLQVGASLVSSSSASHAHAHPKPRPVRCG